MINSGENPPLDEKPEKNHLWKINKDRKKKYIRNMPVDFSWLVRVAGVIGHCFENNDVIFGASDRISWALERDFVASGFVSA